MASNNEKYIDNRLKWENSYNTFEDFFGKSPSEAAVKAAKVFKDNQVNLPTRIKIHLIRMGLLDRQGSPKQAVPSRSFSCF